MLLADVASASRGLAATRSRLAKRDIIVELLRRTPVEDVEVVVAYVSGALPQRRTGIGWSSLGALPEPAEAPTLSVAGVDAALSRISRLAGTGSVAARSAAVAELFGTATGAEQALLRGLVSGDPRQGALEAAVVDAVAVAAAVPLASVRRAVMLRGAVAPVAAAALRGGVEAVADFTLTVGRPVRPMLASSAADVPAALAKLAAHDTCLDAKLDGIRIQAHKRGAGVRVFTRSLEDVTERLPEVVAVVQQMAAEDVILDGEAMTLTQAGQPRPFQETAARTARRLAGTTTTRAGAGPDNTRVTPFFFDILHRDGTDLIDLPLVERLAQLETLVPATFLVSRMTSADPGSAQRFFEECIADGQEGVVVKALDAAYEAGRRGSGWVKVKPRHTLDLVVLAVEWGSGRRSGSLSNIHLGARDLESGGFVMLGKTFKGMTDAMLSWQTQRFLELEQSRSAHVVTVRPEQVVEVAFDGLQRSTRYAGGWALRFARVIRYREDKRAAEADTMDRIRALADPNPPGC